MSRKRNCWDNAVMERFFLNLKMERVWQKDYANPAEATNDIADYIVGFHNSERLHSKLGNLPPNAFEQKSATSQPIGLCEITLPGHTAMAATVVGLSTFAFALLGGWLSDRFGRRPVMLWPRLLAAVISYPAFMFLVEQKTAGALYLVAMLLAALTAISGAASLVAIPELFPRRIRALGMSVTYAVGVALFGGTTQFVITWLIGVTGNPASPAWYVAGTSMLAVLGMYLMPEGRGSVLKN
jgi:MFS family permease